MGKINAHKEKAALLNLNTKLTRLFENRVERLANLATGFYAPRVRASENAHGVFEVAHFGHHISHKVAHRLLHSNLVKVTLDVSEKTLLIAGVVLGVHKHLEEHQLIHHAEQLHRYIGKFRGDERIEVYRYICARFIWEFSDLFTNTVPINHIGSRHIDSQTRNQLWSAIALTIGLDTLKHIKPEDSESTLSVAKSWRHEIHLKLQAVKREIPMPKISTIFFTRDEAPFAHAVYDILQNPLPQKTGADVMTLFEHLPYRKIDETKYSQLLQDINEHVIKPYDARAQATKVISSFFYHGRSIDELRELHSQFNRAIAACEVLFKGDYVMTPLQTSIIDSLFFALLKKLSEERTWHHEARSLRKKWSENLVKHTMAKETDGRLKVSSLRSAVFFDTSKELEEAQTTITELRSQLELSKQALAAQINEAQSHKDKYTAVELSIAELQAELRDDIRSQLRDLQQERAERMAQRLPPEEKHQEEAPRAARRARAAAGPRFFTQGEHLNPVTDNGRTPTIGQPS